MGNKVAIVLTSTGWGGLEMNTLKLARELQKKGCSIYFIVRKDSRFANELNTDFEDKLELSDVKKYFDFKNAKKVNNFLNEHSIHLIFSSFRPDLDLISWVKKRAKSNIKVIHQQHMQIGIPKKGLIQRMRYKAIDSWISPLEWLKTEVLEKTTISAKQISVIPIGVDTKRFISPTLSKNEAQELFKCSTADKLIGVIGRIDEKKGQLFLVQAIQKLRSQGINVALLIVGEPTINDTKGKEYYDKLMEFISDNKLENHVFIADYTTNVAEFYQAIDVFVMSSVGETYGMVTLEAMLSKTPVIGTNSGGTTEILGEGQFGELYEVGNIDSFCDGYKSLLNRVESGELNLDTIQKHVIDQYGLDREIDGVFDLINSSLLK